MKQVDLHLHSTYSDGTDTPEVLVEMAKALDLSAIALTDHDTCDGCKEAIEHGRKIGVEVIPGAELSTSWGEKEIHIVGLFLNPDDETLNKRLAEMKDGRAHRNELMCAAFRERGIPMEYEDLLETYGSATITRATFADWLMNHGFIKSRQEAFDRYIGDYGPCYVPRRKISSQEGIRYILEAGGVPVLAHPILYHLSKDNLVKLITELKEAGLIGIEGVYTTYSQADTRLISTLAKDHGLLLSGGSDYHGANKPRIHLGVGHGHLFVPASYLEGLRSWRDAHRT